MSIKAKPTVQDILARFNSAMKTAEEAQQLQDDGLLSDPQSNDKDAEVGKEEAAPAPADDVEELDKDKERGEDAGQVLGAIAKEAAEAHYDALKKEAAVFGEIFAKAAVDQMNKLAAEYDEQMQKQSSEQEAMYFGRLCKQAAEEAYVNTLQAMQPGLVDELGNPIALPAESVPAEELPVASVPVEATTAEAAPEATLGDAADAVTTSAQAALEAARAATALTKAIQEQDEGPEEDAAPADLQEEDEPVYDPEAAQEAYDNTMSYLQQPQMQPQPQAGYDPVAEQAYANTMAAMQGQG